MDCTSSLGQGQLTMFNDRQTVMCVHIVIVRITSIVIIVVIIITIMIGGSSTIPQIPCAGR